MESYGILPPNCAFRKVLQLVVIRPQEFFAAVGGVLICHRTLPCRATVCELVHLCNMWNAVREHPPRRALYSPKMTTHLDNEQSIVAAAQAGDLDAFITLLNAGRLPHLRKRN